MNKEDYYKILGIDRNASDMEVKKAYKKMAMKYHPDRNPGDKKAEENFKKVGEAYEILSDSNKRQIYDQYGHSGFNNASNAYSNSTSHFTDIFGDIFGDLFGDQNTSSKNKSYSYRGDDLLHILKIDLEDAASGLQATFKINTQISCDKCNGSGAKDKNSFIKCTKCNGYGQIRLQQGFLTIQQTCDKCSGQGSYIKEVCSSCYGKGRIKSEKTISAKIPAGINDNDKIKLNEEGEIGKNGGPAGDLYIQIKIKKHDIFIRKESDLYCDVPITFNTAILGGEIEVPSLTGSIKIKIPKETQTNKVFRIKNKGMKSLRNNSYGDLFCKIIIETPIELTDIQIKILTEFETTIKRNNFPKIENWKLLIKDFLNKKIK
ncbi:MAG TPA: molecular chaperone DnaJ [Candidatus Azoamicus sp.]